MFIKEYRGVAENASFRHHFKIKMPIREERIFGNNYKIFEIEIHENTQ